MESRSLTLELLRALRASSLLWAQTALDGAEIPQMTCAEFHLTVK